MRNDADFAAYLAARWPFLVRSLVLIGCPQAEAEDVVQAGLARCHDSWDKAREDDDIDVFVYRTVLDGCHKQRRGWSGPPEVAPTEELTDAELLRREIEAELRRLTPEDRDVLVLRFVAELSEVQVADLLERPVGTVPSRFSEVDFRIARETIEVPPPPYDAVVRRATDLRRRRRRFVAVGLVVGAVVVAALVWVSTRPAPEPEQPAVVESENPIEKPWYGAGRLHLQDVAVDLPQVHDLISVAGGVVYADDDGVLVYVGPAGEPTEIGRKSVGARVVASDERSWVVWVDERDDPQLIVWDVVDDYEVARVEVASGASPVALDQNRVYYLAEGRTHTWDPLTGRVEDAGLPLVLDVESATRVYGDGERIDMVQPFFSVNFVRPGATADLSPGGTFVLARPPGQLGPFQPLIYDARSGELMPTGLGPEELAVDAAFGPAGTVEYLVIQATDTGDEDALLVLRSCYLATDDCTDIVPLPTEGEEPRLAH